HRVRRDQHAGPGHREARRARWGALPLLAQRQVGDHSPRDSARVRQRRRVAHDHELVRVAMTANAAVEAEGLYRFFHAGDEETVALAGVTIYVAIGELVAVVGPSGSGKSTLLACLAGLDEPDGGTVRIAGETMTRRPEARRAALRARSVGLLLQANNLFDHLCVRDNLRLAQRLAGGPASVHPDRLLDELGLVERATAWPTTLSGGEAARAGLALALANDPTVLLADEPTGELDV